MISSVQDSMNSRRSCSLEFNLLASLIGEQSLASENEQRSTILPTDPDFRLGDRRYN
jgi:hypothetical protein